MEIGLSHWIDLQWYYISLSPFTRGCKVRFNSIFSIQINLSNLFYKILNYKQICLIQYFAPKTGSVSKQPHAKKI
ncbi:hypothetical protein BpHYR1_008240 [Brachionus plicatilis]|uniref:Uncharacterized protein n=1 Tax=Brachionus plicatilis TaxID=10195 RepID=A0A3M7QLA0_BRAPC|nr:hypothetical protein BpHYR1_008240 [Brachionus plicatilis]